MTTSSLHAAKADWSEHCRVTLQNFVSNVVVIDNEPVTNQAKGLHPSDQLVPLAVDDGMTAPVHGEPLQTENAAILQSAADSDASAAQGAGLDVRSLSDAFADMGVLCAFVLPDDKQAEDDATKTRVLKAAEVADMVVLDWYLKDQDPTITKGILSGIAKADQCANGRLRLICIYTGWGDRASVLQDAVESLEEGGLHSAPVDKDTDYVARGENHVLVVVNKKEVIEGELPKLLIQKMSRLTMGLLPSFALASVAAIRRNAHHIVTRFPSALDGAFVANRLISRPPEQMVRLLRELFLSDCDTAIDLAEVERSCLDREAIRKWMAAAETCQDSDEQQNEGQAEPSQNGGPFVNSQLLYALLESGMPSNDTEAVAGTSMKLKDKKKKLGVSERLCGGPEKSLEAELNLARRAAMRLEAFGDNKVVQGCGWSPNLTLGAVLRGRPVGDEAARYYYCLTPACDTLRIGNDGMTFVMVELVAAPQSRKEKFNLVLVDENESNLALLFKPSMDNVRTFRFTNPDDGLIKGKRDEDRRFWFLAADGTKLLWLGEVRSRRATRDMADLNRQWLRLGINDTEYLRLHK